jgi:hypothetical protein
MEEEKWQKKPRPVVDLWQENPSVMGFYFLKKLMHPSGLESSEE